MLRFHPMTEDEKYQIAAWQYTGEYALYNMSPYEEDLTAKSGFARKLSTPAAIASSITSSYF